MEFWESPIVPFSGHPVWLLPKMTSLTLATVVLVLQLIGCLKTSHSTERLTTAIQSMSCPCTQEFSQTLTATPSLSIVSTSCLPSPSSAVPTIPVIADCDKETNRTIQWVNATVPAEIARLFISNGLCSEPPPSWMKFERIQIYIRSTLCDFVRQLTDQYVSSNHDKYVESAIGLIHERGNKEEFNCSDMTKINARKTSQKLKAVPPQDNKIHKIYHEVIDALSSSSDSDSCTLKCENLGPLCDVAATLTDLTLEKKKVNPTCLPGVL